MRRRLRATLSASRVFAAGLTSAAITPGTDLFVDLQSINDPAAASFSPDRVRVAKSLDGMDATAVSTPGCIIRITEGFSRAFVDSDSNNDGVNINDCTSSSELLWVSDQFDAVCGSAGWHS